MTLDEAIKKAESPAQPKNPTEQKDPYQIPFEMAESAKRLVGKTLRSKDPENSNKMEIVKWVKQNYILLVNGTDYSVTPVMWILQNLNKMIVE